jgi:FSR family fosmidomycin resistance protein-like MFS transporter
VLAHALLDCYGGFWPIFKYLAKIDIGVAGGLATGTSFFAMLMQPLFGHLADSGRTRLFVLGGTALTLLMALLGPVAMFREALGSLPFMLLMVGILFLTRIGQSMFHPVAGSEVGSLIEKRRSTLLAVFVAAGWGGVGLSQPAFSWAYIGTGGHSEVLLVPGLLILAVIAAWYRHAGGSAAAGPSGRGLSIPRGRAGRKILVLFMILSMTDFLSSAWSFLMPEFAEQKGCPPWIHTRDHGSHGAGRQNG